MKAVHMVQIIREIRPAPAFILSAQPIKYFSTWIRQRAPCKRKKTRFKYMNTEKRWGYIGLCQILIFPIFQVDGYSDGKPDEALVTRLSLSLQKYITQITMMQQCILYQKIILVSKFSFPQIRALVLRLRVPLSFASAFGFLPKTHFETYTKGAAFCIKMLTSVTLACITCPLFH